MHNLMISTVLILSSLRFAVSAQAGEKEGTLFGHDVIFEVGAAYGSVNNFTQKLNDSVDGTALSIPAAITSEDMRYADSANIFCFVPCGHPFRTAGFSANVAGDLSLSGKDSSTNLNFGFSSQVSKHLQFFAGIDVTRLSFSSAQNDLLINATVQSEVRPLTSITDTPQFFSGNGTIITTTHLGEANVSAGFSDTNIYGAELGFRHDTFPPITAGQLSITPFAEVGVGFAYFSGIDLKVSGDIPDFSGQPNNFSVTSDFFGTNINLAGSSNFSTPVANVPADVRQKIISGDIQPRLSIGGGVTADIDKLLKLSLEYRHTRMSVSPDNGGDRIKIRTNLFGARLSRVF